jgi:arylsulfatase A
MYPVHLNNQTAQVPLPLNAQNKSRELCMATPDAFNYTTDAFTDAALRWLHEERAPARPFFLYLSFTVPHAGGWGTEPQEPEQGNPVPTDLQYADKDWPIVEKDHAASVTYLDGRVGDVLGALDTLGLTSDTVVFFAADNGAHNEGGHDVHFFDSPGGLQGFKRSYYEGGVRSPSIIRWPGVTKPASISATPWAFWDVLPTMLDIAGASPPADAVLDGRSIVPALRGEEQPASPYMYWTWNGWVKEGQEWQVGYAVRVGDWKAVVQSCANQTSKEPSQADVMELYRLPDDPTEADDVASDHASVVASIKEALSGEGLSCACYQCP